MRGRSRSRSRIERRVGSASAFHTGSSLSLGPEAILGTGLLSVLFQFGEHVAPSPGHALAVLRIDHAERAMPQHNLAAARRFLDFYFNMVLGRMCLKTATTHLQQTRGLTHLPTPPYAPNPLPP